MAISPLKEKEIMYKEKQMSLLKMNFFLFNSFLNSAILFIAINHKTIYDA